jgi:hypothetical protein
LSLSVSAVAVQAAGVMPLGLDKERLEQAGELVDIPKAMSFQLLPILRLHTQSAAAERGHPGPMAAMEEIPLLQVREYLLQLTREPAEAKGR